jgi:hypothetical protein
MKNILLLALASLGGMAPAEAAPATWVQSVTYQGETVTLRLTRLPLRGPHFELWAQKEDGAYEVVTPVAERAYLGGVDGHPGAVSCGILRDNGEFKGAVYFTRGVTWFTRGEAVVDTRALAYASFARYGYPTAPTVVPRLAGTVMYGFDLGVDADYDYFAKAGKSVAAAFEGIEYSLAVTRAIYMRDCLLRPYLGRVIIRASRTHDPYTGLSGGEYLNAVRAEWNQRQTTADRDAVTGVSPDKIGGGLAWVGVIGTSHAYSVVQSNREGNFDVVFRHELGHNWDCGHYVGGNPEGKGIMGGNQPGRFSGCEVYRILRHRARRKEHLTPEGVFTAVALPPYAALDTAQAFPPDAPEPVIKVLANDHDANGQPLRLTAFEDATAEGGTVRRQGTNLLYRPPDAFVGTDWFTYTVADSAGQTATGVVVVNVQRPDPRRLYLPLDDTAGTVAANWAEDGRPGRLSGTTFAAASVPGRFGNALQLDGVNDHVRVSGLRLRANTVTLTAWIKPAGAQRDWAGIIFDRSDSATGLNFGTDGELRYHWNDAQWGWDSGLKPPAGRWSFVALVVQPQQATLYLNSGDGFQSAVRKKLHAPVSFGATDLGRDPSNRTRHFRGALDDVRLYGRALSETELRNLYAGEGVIPPDDHDGDGLPDAVDPDDDNDGMPDAWEIRHGLDPRRDDRTGNPDHDPADNWHEYVADTDPRNADSRQRFHLERAPGAGETTLRFSTSALRRYTVLYRDDLASGAWRELAPPAPGTGAEMRLTDTASAPRRFYQLRIELP